MVVHLGFVKIAVVDISHVNFQVNVNSPETFGDNSNGLLRREVRILSNLSLSNVPFISLEKNLVHGFTSPANWGLDTSMSKKHSSHGRALKPGGFFRKYIVSLVYSSPQNL